LFEAQGSTPVVPAEQDDLSQDLLNALVDTCEIISEGGATSVRLQKALPF
jgi:hypothetical protein